MLCVIGLSVSSGQAAKVNTAGGEDIGMARGTNGMLQKGREGKANAECHLGHKRLLRLLMKGTYLGNPGAWP